jgi:hypothetical protein
MTTGIDLRAPARAWAMSIRELDSWHAYYRTRERGLGLGCGALTGAEQAHRADILRNIALRHEARRHSSTPEPPIALGRDSAPHTEGRALIAA